jgi:hypothetical protein
MTWELTLPAVATGALGGLLWSRLVLARGYSMTPGSTRRRVLALGVTFTLIALVVWLALSDTGDAIIHSVSRKTRGTWFDGAVYVALNVAIIDSLLTVVMKSLGKNRGRT